MQLEFPFIQQELKHSRYIVNNLIPYEMWQTESSSVHGIYVEAANWEEDQWKGYFLEMNGELRRISGNTSDTISVVPPFSWVSYYGDYFTILKVRDINAT